MTPFDSCSLVAQALGLALAHSLWQITLLWLLFKALTWRLQRHNDTVYLLALCAMLGALAWAAATFSTEYGRLSEAAVVAVFEERLLPSASSEAGESLAQPAAKQASSTHWLTTGLRWLERRAAPIGWIWLLCASLLWLRLLGGWLLLQRLRRHDAMPPDAHFQNICATWARHLGIGRSVQLLESARVVEPLTLGFWKPIILFPVGMFARLSPAQVEALLLHELAHIRRHDYVVNLLQLTLEACFFYHPMFWLLSGEARARREFCCDDVVLRHTSNPLVYAQTLTDMQHTLVHSLNNFAMKSTGRSHFAERILRIVGITPRRSAPSAWWFLMLLPLFAFLAVWWPAERAEASSAPLTHTLVEPFRAAPHPSVPLRNEDIPARPVSAVAQSLIAMTDTVPPSGPSVVVAAAPLKLNVFYIGVDNPLRIAASGVPAEELVPRLVGAGSISGSRGDYVVRVTEQGDVVVQVYRKQGEQETLLSEETYRAKRIPDPTPKLGGQYTSRNISLSNLRDMRGVEVVLENFLFDATCEVEGYELTVLSKSTDPVSRVIKGGQFSDEALKMFNLLETDGGAVFIDDIRIKCPGDAKPRKVGGLVFKIGAAE